MKREAYVYYEIWVTISEMKKECCERCVTLDIAKDHLATRYGNWYEPIGTGEIYEVSLIPEDNGSITRKAIKLYEK